MHCSLSLFILSNVCCYSFFLFSSLSKDPVIVKSRCPGFFVIDGRMEEQGKRLKEISFA